MQQNCYPLFTQWVTDESNAANEVKKFVPVLVVMGNSPYSVSSSNKSLWITNLMNTYKQAVCSDVELFRTLCTLGRQLVELHLLESPEVGQFITRYPAAGENLVDKGYPKYTPPTQDQPGRVHINKTQYFEGVPPEVWEFYIGGYQVLEKWLKDRRGRRLSYDELAHYQQIVVALHRTIMLMARIDEVIPEWPIH